MTVIFLFYCHSEQSEESMNKRKCPFITEILHYVQNDVRDLCFFHINFNLFPTIFTQTVLKTTTVILLKGIRMAAVSGVN